MADDFLYEMGHQVVCFLNCLWFKGITFEVLGIDHESCEAVQKDDHKVSNGEDRKRSSGVFNWGQGHYPVHGTRIEGSVADHHDGVSYEDVPHSVPCGDVQGGTESKELISEIIFILNIEKYSLKDMKSPSLNGQVDHVPEVSNMFDS